MGQGERKTHYQTRYLTQREDNSSEDYSPQLGREKGRSRAEDSLQRRDHGKPFVEDTSCSGRIFKQHHRMFKIRLHPKGYRRSH